MARTVRDSKLQTRTARSALAPRGKPYYRAIEPGVHLGYRKPLQGTGKWVLRRYVGGESYSVAVLATADDSTDADGVTILSFAQAQDMARKRMSAAAIAHGEPKAGPYTVADAMADYCRFLESDGRPETAVRDARYRDRAFIQPKLGTEQVPFLTSDKLRRWRDELVKAGPRLRTKKGEKQKHGDVTGDDAKRSRRASASRIWTLLRAALNHAFSEGKVPSDLAWRKVKPLKAVDGARVRYLTLAEAKRLINAGARDFRLLVQAALQTGARYGELARLTVSDFNPDVGTINVRQSKSGKPRHIVLTDEGQSFFKQVTAGRAGDELIFRKVDGTAWGASHQLRPMADAVARAKIKPAISFHGLRHTWASLSIMRGVPLMVVARNLGHADTRMCERHYGHMTQNYVADAIRAGAPKFGFKAGNVATIGRGR